jgi:hypothetical protein
MAHRQVTLSRHLLKRYTTVEVFAENFFGSAHLPRRKLAPNPRRYGSHASKRPIRANPTKVTAAYCQWLHFKNPYANPSPKAVLTELKEWGWEGGTDKHREASVDRSRFWLMPRLGQARGMFAARLGTNPFEGLDGEH